MKVLNREYKWPIVHVFELPILLAELRDQSTAPLHRKIVLEVCNDFSFARWLCYLCNNASRSGWIDSYSFNKDGLKEAIAKEIRSRARTVKAETLLCQERKQIQLPEACIKTGGLELFN